MIPNDDQLLPFTHHKFLFPFHVFWSMNACFFARRMPLTPTQGAPPTPIPSFPRPAPYPTIPGLVWAIPRAGTLSARCTGARFSTRYVIRGTGCCLWRNTCHKANRRWGTRRGIAICLRSPRARRRRTLKRKRSL
jgi:hypothetical protein